MNTELALLSEEEFNTKIATMEDNDVYLAIEYIYKNPNISMMKLDKAPEPIYFEQTKDSLLDIEEYRKFIKNVIRRFRKSRDYKGYKSYLMCIGMNRCQILGNITDEMAEVEMHHNFLTIFDIAVLISQHILNTIGKITSFDLICLLSQEHRNNNIPIVMLSKTVHEMYHDDPNFYIPISMTFGKWWDLLIKYRYGITLDIADKVINYISKCQLNNELNTSEYFQLKQSIESWGRYNDYTNNHVVNNYNNNFYYNSYINT